MSQVSSLGLDLGVVENKHLASPYSTFWGIFSQAGVDMILANEHMMSWNVCPVSDWHQIWQAFIFHMDGLWLQNRMPKFPPEPQLSRLKPGALLDPSTSLSLALFSTRCPRLLFNAHIIWCDGWCTILGRKQGSSLPNSPARLTSSNLGSTRGRIFMESFFLVLQNCRPTISILILQHTRKALPTIFIHLKHNFFLFHCSFHSTSNKGP